MNIVWSPEAIADLVAVREFIAVDNPAAARDVVQCILDAIEGLLPRNPHIGRPGRVSGTRELVVSATPYVVPYRVRRDTLQILRVYHGARRWPDQL